MTDALPEHWRWFPQSRFGLFVHWGPYAALGRGEQVANRECIEHSDYAEFACRWNPAHYDPRAWADVVARAGMKYAVLTTRHHDGYCLWDTALTDYSSAQQAPHRDFVAEYVEAFRDAGLRVGLYYSVADFRIPAYWSGPEGDPEGFARLRECMHAQVRELLSNYGHIDIMWFDKAEPHSAEDWRSAELVHMMRQLQPHILMNQRLGAVPPLADGSPGPPLGDFASSEHSTRAHAGLWESCLVSTWRLWGYAPGERWKPTDQLLDNLVDVASKAGNLLLNVGPDGDGRLPAEFCVRAEELGRWLETHGDAIYGSEGGNLTEFLTRGYQIVKGDRLYLVIRFWDGEPEMSIAGLLADVRSAKLLTNGQPLRVEQRGDTLVIAGLPAAAPTSLFPVIELECATPPRAADWVGGAYYGSREHGLEMALRRGTSLYADGRERDA